MILSYAVVSVKIKRMLLPWYPVYAKFVNDSSAPLTRAFVQTYDKIYKNIWITVYSKIKHFLHYIDFNKGPISGVGALVEINKTFNPTICA